MINISINFKEKPNEKIKQKISNLSKFHEKINYRKKNLIENLFNVDKKL